MLCCVGKTQFETLRSGRPFLCILPRRNIRDIKAISFVIFLLCQIRPAVDRAAVGLSVCLYWDSSLMTLEIPLHEAEVMWKQIWSEHSDWVFQESRAALFINCGAACKLWDLLESFLLPCIWQCVSKPKLFKVLFSIPWWFTWHLLRKFWPYGGFTCVQIDFLLFSLAYRPYGFWHISRYLMANALVWKTQRWGLVRKNSLFILWTHNSYLTHSL